MKTWQDVIDKVETFGYYGNNWDGCGAVEIYKAAIDGAVNWCRWAKSVGHVLPLRVCPSLDGKVSIEWMSDEWRTNIDFGEHGTGEVMACRSFILDKD